MSDRKGEGQSEIIGLVVIFGIVITSISIILLAGLPVVENATENAQIERYQTEFAFLDQQIRESVYGPGQSSASISTAGGRVSVDDGSGSMAINITYRPTMGTSASTGELTLGGIEYDAGGARGVAYELGGVWAKFRSSTVLEKPPDVTYSGGSLEMNLMNFTSERVVGGDSTRTFYLSSEGTDRNDGLRRITNGSLGPGELEVSVRSEFADGWAEYFNRTMESSAVDVKRGLSPDNRGFANVTIETGPPLYGVENALNGDGSLIIDPTNEVNLTDSRTGDVSLSNYTGTQLPPPGIGSLPDAADACFRTFEGEDLGSVSSPITSGEYETDVSSEISDETFVADGGDIEIYADTSNLNLNSGDTTEFDTSGGNVEIHVDGRLTLNGDIEINGTNSVYFYARDRVTVNGNVDIDDGRTERLQILTSGGANIDDRYNGTVYAQDDISINSAVRGAAISATQLDIGSDGYTHDVSLRGAAPDCADKPLRQFNAVERRVAVR